MKKSLKRLMPPIVADFMSAKPVKPSPPRILDAPLRSCVHPYCGFRYGAQEYHPYETYQIELQRGTPLRQVRRQFIDFLRSYRPRHFGEALGVSLSRPWAAVVYPWEDRDPGDWRQHGWRPTSDESPDLLTHFSAAGILSLRIDEEFMWLEKSLRAISIHGYQPAKYGPAEALELRCADGRSAFLLLDGNHRAGALVALRCCQSIVVRCEQTVHESSVDTWPSVRLGRISRADALTIFNAFFSGNTHWQRSEVPADIIAPPGWQDLYLR